MANPTSASLAFRSFRLVKTLLLCWLLLCLFSFSAFSQTVYKTRTGEKYHRDGCRYLNHSKIECTIEEALEEGLTPCSVCKPSSGSAQQTTQNTKPTLDKATQCTAKTKAGARCSRMTKEVNGRCWQHQ